MGQEMGTEHLTASPLSSEGPGSFISQSLAEALAMTWHQGHGDLHDELCREPPAFTSSSAGGSHTAFDKPEMCPFLGGLLGGYGLRMEKVGTGTPECASGPIHLRRTALAVSMRQSGPWQAG